MKLLQKAETVAAERRAKIAEETAAANAKDAMKARQSETARFKPLVEILLRDIRGKAKTGDAEELADLMHSLGLSGNDVVEHRLFLARYLEAAKLLEVTDIKAARAELEESSRLSRGWAEYARQEQRKTESRLREAKRVAGEINSAKHVIENGPRDARQSRLFGVDGKPLAS